MAKLYIVGTPIGNLKDITLRALEVLKAADVIACEDTRHSRTLLSHYDIKTRLVSYHKFNEAESADKLIDFVLQGKNVALITDAGMPSVSDPGAEVVSRCHEKGVEVEVVPGPTALTSAVALCGVKASGFVFAGFLPEKKSAKEKYIKQVAAAGLPIVLYVAPHDVKKTAEFLLDTLGDRTVYAVRELTKLHECSVRSKLSDFQCEEKGEIVLIIEGKEERNELLDLSVEEHLMHYIDLGVDKKDAIKMVATERNMTKNDVYQTALDI